MSAKLSIPLLLISAFALLFAFDSCKEPCEDLKCQNGGQCIDNACQCPTGYTGLVCEIIDTCATQVCFHGGVCVGGVCDCPTEYEGVSCQTQSRDKFLGLWNGKATCATIEGPDHFHNITIDSLNPDSLLPMWIYGFSTNQFFNPVQAMLTDQNEINIPLQDPDTTETTVEGLGMYNPTTQEITWTWTIVSVPQDTTFSCSQVSTR